MKERVIITISRLYGIPGRRVGKKLAEALGIAYYDNESMAEMMSQENAEYFRTAGENKGAEKKFGATTYHQFYQEGGNLQVLSLNAQMFEEQSKLMKELAAKGSAVFVGRCSDFVLKDDPDLVKVFLGAREEYRTEVVAVKEQKNTWTAKTRLREIDKARDTYYRYYTDQPWGLRENYDLCLDAEKLDTDGMVATIKAYVEALK